MTNKEMLSQETGRLIHNTAGVFSEEALILLPQENPVLFQHSNFIKS